MITEISLLKLFLTRSTYEKYSQYVRYDGLTYEAKTLLKDIDLYFNKFEVDEIDLDKFITYFHQMRHPDLSESKHELFNLVFDKIKNEDINYDEDFYNAVIDYFRQRDCQTKIEQIFDEGFDVDLLRQELDVYESEKAVQISDEFVPNDFENIFIKTTRDKGLNWRLNCLNRSIGKLILGDFGIIAAYVDTGKTKFLASEASYMAQQLTEGSVLWFNNEGPEDRIQSQVWCATLEATKEQITQNPERALKKYTEKMNGDKDRIKFFDAVDFSPQKIRTQAEKYNAKLIIIDMIDHLKFGAKEQSEVIRLKNLYKEVRMISRKYCPVLAASQCDGTVTWKDNVTQESKFQRYIGMHQLDFSRSAKQAAGEFIITIGRDADYPNSRYIHVPKNKLEGDGNENSRFIRQEVLFDGQRSIYRD